MGQSARSAAREAATSRKGSARKRSRDFDRDLAEKCERLLGARVASVEYPGGRSRSTVKLRLKKGKPVIVSVRSSQFRADTERKTLRKLSARGTNVPKLLASDGRRMLIQEEIRGERLSQALHTEDDQRIERLLDSALESMADIHFAGSESGLDEEMHALGDSHEWIVGLLDRPAILGSYLEVPAPRPRLKQLESLLAIRKPRFIKWDCRPGNAMVTGDGDVFWFDWEHCGARNRIDDMVWLLADEYVPECPLVEERMLEKYLPRYADDLTLGDARDYFTAYGVFHLSVRLGLILKYKEDGSWWDYEKCLSRDKVGVTLKSALRICHRGGRWARQNPYTEALAPWFEEIADRFTKETDT